MFKCKQFTIQFHVFIFQKINLMTINAMKMYFDECRDDENLELKNLDHTQNIAVNKEEINKLYVRTYIIISN